MMMSAVVSRSMVSAAGSAAMVARDKGEASLWVRAVGMKCLPGISAAEAALRRLRAGDHGAAAIRCRLAAIGPSPFRNPAGRKERASTRSIS
jgi:hypothetical protein